MSNYRKLRKIGEGAFGKAWLVEDTKIDKMFVVKEIKISKMEDKNKCLAVSEVAILSNLKHPNIVLYIDSYIENNNLCIVTEYCEGGDLFSKIIAHREKSIPFTEEQILEWFLQLTSALNYIHAKKILHRDLKSQNIFLKNGCIKLGDFGIARVLTNTLELAKTCIGTPVAFSPEIVQGEPYNHKSDIWSLGCILYELTMLKLPFTADNMNGLFFKILRATFEPIKFYYSQELSDVITQMLRRSPDRRPNTDDILGLPLFQRLLKNASNERFDIRNTKVSASPTFRIQNVIKKNEKDKKPFLIKAQPKIQKSLSRQSSEERKPNYRSSSCNSMASRNNLQSRRVLENNHQNKIIEINSKKQQMPRPSSISIKIREKPPSSHQNQHNNNMIKNLRPGKENLPLELLQLGRSKVPKWIPSNRDKN